MSRTITQREARRFVGITQLPSETAIAINTARKLDHAVVVQMNGTTATFFALRVPGAQA